jgi:hypothetical protein
MLRSPKRTARRDVYPRVDPGVAQPGKDPRRSFNVLVTYQESKLQFGVCTDARVSTDRFARFSSAADSLKRSVFVEAQAELSRAAGSSIVHPSASSLPLARPPSRSRWDHRQLSPCRHRMG